MRRARLLAGVIVILTSVAVTVPASAELRAQGQAILFYTDDVGIFSATRRLSRDGDPTQPALDTRLTQQGSDVVLEPQLDLSHSYHSAYGTTIFDLRGQGFVFTDHTRYNQASLRAQVVHEFAPETRVRMRYYYAPAQLLGDNEEHRSGMLRLTAEKLSSHIWSTRLERALTPDLEIRLLARYGLRRYNESFAERNTDFGTIGAHVDWRVLPWMKLGISYHYERGLAEGRHQPQFQDDVSYVNHYLSADLDIELTNRLTLLTAFHFERNNWTSDFASDERRGAHENIYQGEVILVRKLTEQSKLFGGVQYSSRKQSFESQSAHNTNIGAGVQFAF